MPQNIESKIISILRPDTGLEGIAQFEIRNRPPERTKKLSRKETIMFQEGALKIINGTFGTGGEIGLPR